MNTKGFYRLTEDTGEYIDNNTGQNIQIDFAPNFVNSPDYELLIENSDIYEYPIHGWYYFTNEEEMLIYFNVKKIESPINKDLIE